ncbi:MAG: hypothetical protein WB791_02970 [Waddliaceae bacterium]
MFLRATAYNENVIFYFDWADNKYVAVGGTLAWRLNNPGLVHSHSGVALKNGAIGTFQKFAIFPNSTLGEKALVEWLYLKKYFDSPLIAVAQHYQPKNPKMFLVKLCDLSSVDADSKPSNLTKKQFGILLWAIKKLANFSSQGNENFFVLPKIISRFHSKNGDTELYLVGNDQFLTKPEAIRWVETHQLDAVLVHRVDGSIYLRSRPGHHFNKLQFTQKEYGKDIKFEDIVRETGTKKSRQCVWGYVNGVSNKLNNAEDSMNLISSMVSGEQVWSLINDEKLMGVGDLAVCVCIKLSIRTPIVKLATQFFKFLLNLSENNSPSSPVIVIAHSQGALISDLALEKLTPKERKKIRIFTFGGASFIPPGKAHSESHNFISLHDPIPGIASPNLSYILLRREDGYTQDNSDEQIITQLADEDADYYLDTRDPNTVNEFTRQRRKHYQNLFHQISNVTVLKENTSGSWEHSFDIPCYQSQLKEILNPYRENN